MFMGINKEQWKVLAQALFATTGPLAWLLSRKLGLSDAEAAMWLNFAAVLTPVIATAFLAAGRSNAAQGAAIASASPEVQAQIVSKLPDEVKIAAATTVPDVTKIVVKDTATDGAAAMAADSAQPKVVPESANKGG